MPAPVRQVVYVDTNVVIEATRTGCWKALLERFDVRTVAEVRREAQAGDPKAKEYVAVDVKIFKESVTVCEVTQKQIVSAQLRSRLITQIDAGERDLLAYVAAQDKSALVLTTGDRAAVRAACALGLDNQLRSLEELAKDCGERPAVGNWFTKTWLGKVKTECLLDSL